MFCLDRPKDRQQRVGDKEFVDDLPRGLSLFRNNGKRQNPRQAFGVLRGGGGWLPAAAAAACGSGGAVV